MKSSDRDAIFTSLIKISELLLKECEALGEIVDCFDDAFIVAKRVISHNVEILEVQGELNFLCDERLLHNDPEVRALFSIIEAIKECSDNIEDLSRGFVRYNVTSLRENSVSSILDLERAAKIVSGLILKLKANKKVDSSYKDIIELGHFKVEQKKMFDINVNKLFTRETDPIEVIKWERVYSSIYKVFSSFDSVSVACAGYNLEWD